MPALMQMPWTSNIMAPAPACSCATHLFSLFDVDEPLRGTVLSWPPCQSSADMDEVDGDSVDEHPLTPIRSSAWRWHTPILPFPRHSWLERKSSVQGRMLVVGARLGAASLIGRISQCLYFRLFLFAAMQRRSLHDALPAARQWIYFPSPCT